MQNAFSQSINQSIKTHDAQMSLETRKPAIRETKLTDAPDKFHARQTQCEAIDNLDALITSFLCASHGKELRE